MGDALLLASGVSQSGDVDCGAFFQWHFCEPLVVIDRRVTVPSTPNWNVLLEGCRNAVLFCHGGCPDGLAAAHLTACALANFGIENIEVMELSHTESSQRR